MGGFFITNDITALGKPVLIFSKKGLRKYQNFQFGKLNCLYFSKWNSNTAHITNKPFKNKKDVLVGVGTFIYKDKIGSEALELIYNDWFKRKNIFSLIKGHFNLIAYVRKKVYLISDKTNIYHSYYAFYRDKFYFSNSFLSIAQSLPRLTISYQEGFEFICSSTWYGGKTIFKEIKAIPYGKILEINQKVRERKYFRLSFKNKEPKNINNSCKFFKDYFKFLTNINCRVSVDLTGGADSRLINSILRSLNIGYTCYTNSEPDYINDVKIAREITKKENIPHDVYSDYWPSLKKEKDNYKKRIYEMFFIMDGCRSVFNAALDTKVFKYRAIKSDLVISGHAAELMRNFDWTKNNPNPLLDNFIRSNFAKAILNNNKKYNIYKKKLVNKIKKITNISDPLSRLDVCKIYYLFRCMGWAGARITAFNQFLFQLAPFEDFSLNQFLFFVHDEIILNNSYLKKIMMELSPSLAKYPSIYGYNFIYKKKLLDSILVKDKIILKRKIKTLLKIIKPKKRKQLQCSFWQKKAFLDKIFKTKPILVQEIFRIDPDKQDISTQDNIYSLEILLKYFKPKLCSDKL